MHALQNKPQAALIKLSLLCFKVFETLFLYIFYIYNYYTAAQFILNSKTMLIWCLILGQSKQFNDG